MRLIDADELIERLLESRREETETTLKLERFIKKQPTIAIDDDLISREALVDDLSDNAGWDFTSRIGMIISRQPTIEPEPKRGRWVTHRVAKGSEMCDQCGFVQLQHRVNNYCPYCGARME